MTDFTLSRADIALATGLGYRAVRRILEREYRLETLHDTPSLKGGASTERFRLSDIFPRLCNHPSFTDDMAAKLIDADRTFRERST